MIPLGINLTVLIGKNTPRSAPQLLIESLQNVEVTHSDEGYSGFQITFQVGRSGRKDLLDYQLIKHPLLKVFNRVILIITLGAKAQVLMDGIITNHEFTPSFTPGGSTFTITGDDVSVMMDLEQKSVEHTAQDEAIIARVLIGNYPKYGLIPEVIAPSFRDQPTQNERIPTQQGTDLDYLRTLARRFDYVFYVMPGPTLGTNTAYWGPPQLKTKLQKALTVNMESFSNVDSISFQNNALSATAVKGSVQDRKTNKIRSLQESSSDRPSLATQPALAKQAYHKIQQYRETGRDTVQAIGRIHASADRSVDNVVTVTGELNTARYGTLLQARRLVGLRGVGATYDGLYYVKSVTHKISPGEYKQNFTITRDGIGTTTQRLPV
ncbi:MAG: hypothetical protein NVS2B14_16320 [Chamaesiphon sp.]